jgi:NAD(P)-dependent dehydrogenase (short-subunit alcohol dehydrogenase family)
MTTNPSSPTLRKPEMVGQTVVMMTGSSGIGLETGRRARSEGANVIERRDHEPWRVDEDNNHFLNRPRERSRWNISSR